MDYNVGVHLLKEQHEGMKYGEDMPSDFEKNRNTWERYVEEEFDLLELFGGKERVKQLLQINMMFL